MLQRVRLTTLDNKMFISSRWYLATIRASLKSFLCIMLFTLLTKAFWPFNFQANKIINEDKQTRSGLWHDSFKLQYTLKSFRTGWLQSPFQRCGSCSRR